MSIQDEISLIKLRSVEEAYQYALKDEEKLKKYMSSFGKLDVFSLMSTYILSFL